MQVQRITVAEVMHPGAQAVDIHARASLVKALFLSQGVRYLFVLDPHTEAVVGVVTEREVLALFHPEPEGSQAPCVSEIMRPTHEFVLLSDPISVAASAMLAKQLTVLPVLNAEHELCGAITEHSLLSLGCSSRDLGRYRHHA